MPLKFDKLQVPVVVLQLVPSSQVCVVPGGHAWYRGGIRGTRGACMLPEGCAWYRGDMCGTRGACVVPGGHAACQT